MGLLRMATLQKKSENILLALITQVFVSEVICGYNSNSKYLEIRKRDMSVDKTNAKGRRRTPTEPNQSQARPRIGKNTSITHSKDGSRKKIAHGPAIWFRDRLYLL